METTHDELELLKAAAANKGILTVYSLKIQAGGKKYGEDNPREYEKYLYAIENMVAARKFRKEGNNYVLAHLGYLELEQYQTK